MTRTREENAADLAHEAEHPEHQYHVSLNYSTIGESPEDAVTVMFSAMVGPGAMVAEVHDDSGHVRDIDGEKLCQLASEGMGKASRIFLVYSCNEHGDGVTVHRTIEEAEAKRCEDFETEEKPGSIAWNDEWTSTYSNAGWYCWEVEALNLDTLKIEAVTTIEDGVVDWDKVAELVGWKDEDDDEEEQPDPDELTHVGFEPVTIDVEDKEIEARLATFHDRMGRRWVSVEGRYYELTLPRIVRVRTDFEADAEGMIAAKERKDVQADQ